MADKEYMEKVFLAHPNENVRDYVQRLGVPKDLHENAIQGLLTTGEVPLDAAEAAPEGSLLFDYYRKKVDPNLIDRKVVTRYRGRAPLTSYEMAAELDPTDEVNGYTSAEDFAQDTNLRIDVAKDIFDGKIGMEKWTTKKFLKEAIADPKKRGLANIFLEARGDDDSWQSKWAKNTGHEWSDIGVDPGLTVEWLKTGRENRVRKLGPEDTKERLLAAKDEVEVALEQVLTERAPGFAEAAEGGFLSEEEQAGLAPQLEVTKAFAGKAMTEFKELDARRLYPVLVEDLGLNNKSDPASIEKAIRAGKFMAEAQSSEGGEPTVVVMTPTKRSGDTAFEGKRPEGGGTYHFQDFKLELISEEKAAEALADGRLIMDNLNVRFTSYGGDDETVGGGTRLDYNRKWGDSISGVPVYLPVPLKKSIRIRNAADKEGLTMGEPPPRQTLNEYIKVSGGESDWSLLSFGASVLGIPNRLMAGMTEAALEDDAGALDIMKGGLKNLAEMNPEKQTYYATLFTKPEFLKSIGLFKQDDPKLAREIEMLKRRPSDFANDAALKKLENRQEIHRMKKERENWERYKSLKAEVDNAKDDESYREAVGVLSAFRENLYSLAGPVVAGTAVDMLLDPLTIISAMTGKSAAVAARQFEGLGKNSARRLSRASRGRLVEVIDTERVRQGFLPIEPLMDDELNFVTKIVGDKPVVITGGKKPPTQVVPVTKKELKAGAEKVGEKVRKQVEALSSPVDEANDAIKVRQEIFRPERTPTGEPAVPKTADALVTSQRGARRVTEPGRVKAAKDALDRELRQYGKTFNVPDDVVEKELDRVNRILARAEKRGRIGSAGYDMRVIVPRRTKSVEKAEKNAGRFSLGGRQFKTPIVLRRLRLNKTPKLEGPIREFIADNLPALNTGLETLDKATDFAKGVAKAPVEWLALGTSAKKKKIVTAFEEARNEYVDAYMSHNLLKYLDATREASDPAKRLALLQVMRDSKYGDDFLTTSFGRKLAKEWEKAPTALKEEATGVSTSVKAIFGDSELGQKYHHVVSTTKSLDALVPTRLAESAQESSRLALQGEIKSGAFAGRLSGARDPKEVMDEVFSQRELGGSGFYRGTKDTLKLTPESQPRAQAIVDLYEENKAELARAAGEFDAGGKFPGGGGFAKLAGMEDRQRVLDTVLASIFSNKSNKGLSLFGVEKSLRKATKNSGMSSFLDNIALSKGKPFLPGAEDASGFAILNPKSRKMVEDIIDLPEEQFQELGKWFNQSGGQAVPPGQVRKLAAVDSDIPIVDKQFMDSSVSTQVERLFPVLSGDKDVVSPAHVVNKALNFWKGIATVWNPGFHSRNAASGAYLYWAGGGHAETMIQDYRKATYALAVDLTSGELPKWSGMKAVTLPNGDELSVTQVRALADKYGVTDSNFVVSDLPSDFDQISERAQKLAGKGPKRLLKKVGKVPRAVGGFLENQGRSSLFIASLRNGMSPQEAAAHVKRIFFDYGALPKYVKGLKPYVPFITWTSKNLGLQVEELVRNPGKYANLLKVGRAFQENAKQEYGDNWRSQVPEWLQGAAALAMPADLSPDREPWLLKFDIPATTLTGVASFVDKLFTEAKLGTTGGDSANRVGVKVKDELISLFNPLVGGLALLTGATDSVYDPFRERNLRRDRNVTAKGATAWMFDTFQDASPEKMRSFMDFFGINGEKVGEGHKWTYPETSAYLIQMLPPIMNVMRQTKEGGFLSAEDQAWYDRVLNGAIKLLPTKDVTIDRLKTEMSHMYDLQRAYGQLKERDQRYWDMKLEKDERSGIPLPDARFLDRPDPELGK